MTPKYLAIPFLRAPDHFAIEYTPQDPISVINPCTMGFPRFWVERERDRETERQRDRETDARQRGTKRWRER